MQKSMTSRSRFLTSTIFVSSVLATSMLAFASPAFAQDPSAVEEDAIVVTGFRASLADALTSKRESNLILETVTAEDIGEFPDQNIAESLQRLPGIQIDRVNGQGTRVRVRGLDQNVIVLNDEIFLSGFELFRLGEGNDTQTGSLEGVPSELIGGVDVFKSPSADLLEGGLGGIVNLRTRRADSISGDYLFNAQLTGNRGEGGDVTPGGSIVAGWRFSDRFAVLGSLSYDRTDIATESVGGDNRGGWAFFNRPLSNATTRNVYSPEYRYATHRDQERERLGASLNVNFEASDAVELNFDWFHSELDIITSEASLKFPFAGESAVYNAANFMADSNGIFQSGSLTANSAEGISFVQNATSSTDNFQLSMNWDNGGPLTGDFGIYYSSADYESASGNNDVRYTQYTVRNGTPAGFVPNATAPATLTYSYVNGANPTFTPANPAQFNTPTSVFAKSHWAFAENSQLENLAARADFAWDDGGIGVVRAGFRYAVRQIDSEFGRYLADYHGRGELDGINFGQDWTAFGYFQDGAIGFKSCGLPVGTPGRPNCGQTLTDDGRFGASPALITPYQTAATNPERFETLTVGGVTALFQDRGQMTDAAAWIQALYPSTPFTFFQDPLNTFSVEERSKIGYIMVDLDPNEDFHLNAGVRIVGTELIVNSNGTPPAPTYWGTDSWNGVLRNPIALESEREYVDILPSINAVYELNDESKIRASVARVVARQNLFNLGQGSQFNFTRVTDVGSPDLNRFQFTGGNGGNPDLDPFRATQYDFAYEHYFGEQGLLAVGLFYKSVDSFIQNDTVSRFVPDETVDGGTAGSFAQPTNGDGGTIKGVELTAQYGFANGFGFTANYTYSDSETEAFNDFDSDLPIPGVSKNAYNVTGYYENGPFAGRLSYAWRDEYFNGNFGFATSVLGRYQSAYGQLDGQLSFDVTDALQISLEGINLTEEETEEFLQFENLPFRYLSGDRRIMVGARYRLGN